MTATEFAVPLLVSTEDAVTPEQVRKHLHKYVRLDLDTEEMGSEEWMGVGLSIDWDLLEGREHAGRVLVVYEKHGERYFDVRTDELLTVVALKLLRERRADGYYTPGSPPTGVCRTPEEIAALPLDIQHAVRQTSAALRRQQQQYQDAVDFLALVDTVLGDFELAAACRRYKHRTGYPRAFELLAERSDYEYERVEIPDLAMPMLTKRPTYMTWQEYYEAERAGWAIFEVDGRDQVQRLDEADLPLASDEAAWKLAEAIGLQLDAEGYVRGRADSQELETDDADSGNGHGD